MEKPSERGNPLLAQSPIASRLFVHAVRGEEAALRKKNQRKWTMREQSVAERHEPRGPVNRVPGHFLETAPIGRPAPKPDVHREIKPAFEFSKAILLEENHMKTGSRTLSAAVAVLLHVGVIAGIILTGLYFAEPLNIKQYASVILVAPPPPPPPPPPATGEVTKPKVVHHMLMNAGKLLTR